MYIYILAWADIVARVDIALATISETMATWSKVKITTNKKKTKNRKNLLADSVENLWAVQRKVADLEYDSILLCLNTYRHLETLPQTVKGV